MAKGGDGPSADDAGEGQQEEIGAGQSVSRSVVYGDVIQVMGVSGSVTITPATPHLPAPATALHTLPLDVAAFSGRAAELEQLMLALPGQASTGGVVSITAVDGMAGVGKTAFAVHAAHRLASRFPDVQLFVPLHGHTPGQQPVEPADALAAMLLAVGVAPTQVPAGAEERAGLWRDRTANRRMLVVLDDATGTRQVRPLLPGAGAALVLVTSRVRLTALPAATTISLDILAPRDAAHLFVRLVGRPELRQEDDAVVRVVAMCGHLPLAISLVAGHFKHRPAWTIGELADDLRSTTNRLGMMRAEHESVAAAFEVSYHNLPPSRQRLFRRLGLHTSADVDAYAAAALDEIDLVTARTLLDDLYGYHLIDEPARGRYRLHDLIRQYARDLAGTDPPAEREAAVDRLLDYYLHTAQAADRSLARRTRAWTLELVGSPAPWAPELVTREQAVRWMKAERANLHAAVDYAARHDRPGHAIALPAAMHGFLHTHGHWDQSLALHRTALHTAERIHDRSAQAGALNDLGVVQRLTGQHTAAATSQKRALELSRTLGNRLGEAYALTNLAVVQFLVGESGSASSKLALALELYRDLDDALGEANALTYLGIVRQAIGECALAATSLERALELYRDLDDRRGEANALTYLGPVQRAIGEYWSAATSLERALELSRDLGDRLGEANVLANLGVVRQVIGDYGSASANLERALDLYRDLGYQRGEAHVLANLGVVQQATGHYESASASLGRALELSRNLGDRLREAEALNNMGDLLLASSTPVAAQVYHEQALTIARDLAALIEEARALEGIGHGHLKSNRRGDGAVTLRRALAIYRRIGSPYARRVESLLQERRL
jgi:tetratricopeptide (TPR) repeat protein